MVEEEKRLKLKGNNKRPNCDKHSATVCVFLGDMVNGWGREG